MPIKGELTLEREELALEKKFGLEAYKPYLSADVYRKNLWTLSLLDLVLAPHTEKAKSVQEILEPACQDFSRLPALHCFFRNSESSARISGLELDPFPILHDFHSRWDKAKYYLSCVDPLSRYLEEDFFSWQESCDLICCFYPFVSRHPALAWGLPASFGNPEPWVRGFVQNLRPDGLLLVVHQGGWEEEEFDAARAGYPLELLQRESFSASFYPLPFPACASVYLRR